MRKADKCLDMYQCSSTIVVTDYARVKDDLLVLSPSSANILVILDHKCWMICKKNLGCTWQTLGKWVRENEPDSQVFINEMEIFGGRGWSS